MKPAIGRRYELTYPFFIFAIIIFFVIFGQDTIVEPIRQISQRSRLNRRQPNRTLPPELRPIPFSNRSRPLILMWQPYFAKEFTHFVPRVPIQCPYLCEYTSNRKRANEARVRVFHERTLNPDDMPPERRDALNVYFTLEPPYLTFSVFKKPERTIPKDYFHAIGSYRTNTEIFYPYDAFIPLNGNETKEEKWTDAEIDEAIRKKHRPAINAMSNCGGASNRLAFLDALSQHILITRVGGCGGTVQCGIDGGGIAVHHDSDCMRNLNAEHFFYLALENSVCPEYTTEKFWRLKQLIVPIVLSRAAMSPMIPADSYIAASDFDSVEELAKHLEFLMSNQTEYRKFFRWTKHFRRSYLAEREINVACQLCKFAHKPAHSRIPDYQRLWNKDECIEGYGKQLVAGWRDGVNLKKANEAWMRELIRQTHRERFLGRIV